MRGWQQPSLIYIDADHRYEHVFCDISAWRSNLAYDGILCGHDYDDSHPGVIQAVDELLPDRKVDANVWSWRV